MDPIAENPITNATIPDAVKSIATLNFSHSFLQFQDDFLNLLQHLALLDLQFQCGNFENSEEMGNAIKNIRECLRRYATEVWNEHVANKIHFRSEVG